MRRMVVLLCLLLCVHVYQTKAYKDGFGKDSCSTLCPVVNCTSNGAAGEEMELKRSERGFPLSESFVFDDKIRRTTPFRVALTAPKGLHISGLMLLFRDPQSVEDEPLGYFRNFTDNLKAIRCTGGPPNALTNRDFSPKTAFSFEWVPPDLPNINIGLRGTFLIDEEYWYNIEVKSNFQVDTFPPSMSECGKTKSCVTVSLTTAVKCDKASRCDVTLKYGLSPDSRTLEVILGGWAPHTDQYVAVAFMDDRTKMKGARIFSCRRTKDAAAVQHFVLDSEDDLPRESNSVVEEVETEQDGEHVWCSFETPVLVPGYRNLTDPLYQAYLYGTSQKSSGMIQIGPRYATSKTKVEIGVPFELVVTSGASALGVLDQFASLLMLPLFVWLLRTQYGILLATVIVMSTFACCISSSH